MLKSMDAARRTVLFSLSPALAESQRWAVEAFSNIVMRATGYNERWRLMEQLRDGTSGSSIWRYEVQGLPEIDLVVDHIVHELTDAVLLSEQHTVTEDSFTFGSIRRDRPAHTEQTTVPGSEQFGGGDDR